MKTLPNSKPLISQPFICALSGLRVEGSCGCVLRVGRKYFSISLASYENLCQMGAEQQLWTKRRRDGRLENGVAEIVRITGEGGDIGDDKATMGIIHLDRLRCEPDWKARIAQIFLDAQSQVDLPANGDSDGPSEIHTVPYPQLRLAMAGS
jgi:hypothetical protein